MEGDQTELCSSITKVLNQRKHNILQYTLALYERILSLVEFHRSSNVVLQEEFLALVESVSDVVAAFAKVEEVWDAVNQLEQGKASTGRSESLLEVMDSSLQLQHELNDKLQKVASGMNVEDVEVKKDEKKLEKRKRDETEDKEEDSSSDSSSSSSSSSSDDDDDDDDEKEDSNKLKKQKLVEEPKQPKVSESATASDKKQSADLSLAHEALSSLLKMKTVNQRIDLEMKRKWVKTLHDLKLILNHQSSRDAHTTDNPAAEVTVRALETAVMVFGKFEWTPERAEEVRGLIDALTDACSKNEVLRIYFHRVRAELESLEKSIPCSVAKASGKAKSGKAEAA
ncbi:hypothetical protein PI126_g4158 [Phytophthora idaei]|nr:hypothetical protein PI126_g4158 [Phytophthora idaei]